MIKVLTFIRYLLIAVGAVGALHLTDKSSYAVFTCLLLLFIWVGQVRNRWVPVRLHGLFIAIEVGLAHWMASEFGGTIVLLFYSILFSMFVHSIPYRRILIVLQWAALHMAVNAFSIADYLILNALYVGVALLLDRMIIHSEEEKEVQQLYDELRKKHYELEDTRKRLTQYAKEVEQITQLEERSRISRDIHDDLGHKLIRMKMMLEAIVQISAGQEAKATEMTIQVRDQLAESIDTLRSTVRRINPDVAVSRQYSLHTLIEDFATDCGIRVNYQISGSPYPLYPSEELVLYRNAQEAMTNAVRHGKADEVNVHLHYEATCIEFIVSNNGMIPDNLQRKGLGLSGMEERVQLLGGKLKLDLTERFAITTILPHSR